MIFSSDNSIGARPEILEAIGTLGADAHASYGTDALSLRTEAMVREIFEAPEARVFLVSTGSAANALALASLVNPWEAIYCAPLAHINTDECGAPEFYTNGAKLVEVEGDDGKVGVEALETSLAHAAALGVHNVQRGALSLTNLTEAGSAYSAGETAALCAIAKRYDLPVHLDGARFANALAGQNASAADLSWRAGVDVLVLGGTKNGMLFGEAVIFFDAQKAWEFELRRKRGGHLLSKGAVLGAQFCAYLENENWLNWARHANAMMAKLREGAEAKGAKIDHSTNGNIAFLWMTRGQHKALRAAGARYYLSPDHQAEHGDDDDEMIRARLVTSWATREDEIDKFLEFF